jgi:DNA-binding GntR family transcriptional regulator
MKSESMAFKGYTELRKKILTIQVSPDTRLKEDFWAKKLSVSRMAIREALTRLLGEGLVILGPKGGYFVTSFTHEDFAQIRELREILELGAISLACEKITKDQVAKLEKICAAFTSMIEQGFFAGANEADLKFHETLMECSGNEKLLHTYLSSHIPLFHQQLTKKTHTDNDYQQTDKEHRSILDALKDKNVALAKQNMQAHFARGVILLKAD